MRVNPFTPAPQGRSGLALPRHTWGRLVAFLAAAFLLAVGAVLPIASASAAPSSPEEDGPSTAAVEPGDSVWLGRSIGHGGTRLFGIYGERPADPGADPDYWAYCIEIEVSALTGVEGYVGDVDSFLGDNHFADDPTVQGQVFWILAHSYPVLTLEEFGAAAGVPGISQNDAIEATQYAIWRFTDLDWDASWSWSSASSEAAYRYLVDGAHNNPGLSYEDLVVTATIDAPVATQTAGTLAGPFVVHTNSAPASVESDPAITISDSTGTPIDTNAVVDGQEIYLDLRDVTDAGSATVTLSARGTSSTGNVISVPGRNGGAPSARSHSQSIILVTPHTTRTTDAATITWNEPQVPLVPAIGTSLVDAADGDRVIASEGGTVIDTVAYENLTVGTEYTMSGELYDRSTGEPTGLTGTTTFTPAEANGSVEVELTIPEGYAGSTLVAFEYLAIGDTVVASHEDIDDAAQTVRVEEPEEPTTPTPEEPTPPGPEEPTSPEEPPSPPPEEPPPPPPPAP
ncbi:MAG: VaFE repeat-containing surface-anchored protein, partial [Actinomycetaceae bacterium]